MAAALEIYSGEGGWHVPGQGEIAYNGQRTVWHTNADILNLRWVQLGPCYNSLYNLRRGGVRDAKPRP